MARLSKQGRGRRHLHHVAGVHDAHPIRDLPQDAEVVSDVKHRHPVPRAELEEQVQDLRLGRDIQSCRRFVEDHDLGSAGEGHRDDDPLLLPARELVRVTACRSQGVWKANAFQQLDRLVARRDSRASHTMVDQDLGDLVPDPHGGAQRRGRVLRHEADPIATEPVESRPLEPQQVPAVEDDATGENPAPGKPVAHELVGDARLATARLADQSERLAFGDVE